MQLLDLLLRLSVGLGGSLGAVVGVSKVGLELLGSLGAVSLGLVLVLQSLAQRLQLLVQALAHLVNLLVLLRESVILCDVRDVVVCMKNSNV